MESRPAQKLQRTESGAHAGDNSPDHFDASNHPEVFTETHSEEDERHHHESGPSDHQDSAPHPHHKEHMVVALGDVSTKFRVFLGDDVTLKTTFPEGAKVIWKYNNEVLPTAVVTTLLLQTVTAAMLGDYECALVDGSASYRCSLVKNKSPFKWCEVCAHRNHAHAKHCIQCHTTLRAKLRPPKRRCESLTMKNYEDAIVEKLRALKEAHGENVDTLCIISRRHYNRTLTSVHKSPGAATSFLQQAVVPSGWTIERLLSDSWTRWIDHHSMIQGTSARSGDRRRRDESVSPPAISVHGPTQAGALDSTLSALVNSLSQQSYGNGFGPIIETYPPGEGVPASSGPDSGGMAVSMAGPGGPMQGMNMSISQMALQPLAPNQMPSLVLEPGLLQSSLPSLPSHFAFASPPFLQLVRQPISDQPADRP